MAGDSVELEELSALPKADLDSSDQDELIILAEDASLPIAIVGMGFRGPGDATNVQRLWDMIVEGREAWSRIPASKWNNSAFHHPDYARHGAVNVEGGHFLTEDVSLFDAPFFNMTSDEAAAMDPQQRLLLEVAYEGLENDYTDLLLRDPERIPMYQCTNSGQSRAMTANRISYFFDMKGPSVTVDTACSGSLVALHLACQSLRTGDASMAIAAGVNVILSHEFMSTMSMMKFLSPEGRCHTFDQKANGYARGEGIGCVVLKPLRDALRDHDPIRAIIRGSGSNQDGRTAGITLPSGPAQEALIRHVYRSAGLDPTETDFVETHGTGTQAGDPIETAALGKVFCLNRATDRPLRIGSIKTNVGHLEGTSGIAAVIKAALMLENRLLAPNRNFEHLNPRILMKDWKLKVQLCLEPWESPGVHRVSVNSFGYGGSNAHVILEETSSYLTRRRLSHLASSSYRREYSSHDTLPRARVFMLSGSDETSITRQAQRLRTAAVIGTSVTSLADALMGHIKSLGAPFNSIDEILKDRNDSQLNQPLLSQHICSALQIALVDLLRSWGIYPDAVTGHSSGEIAAAYAVGALSMEDAMAVAYYRGVVSSKLVDINVKGGMLALGMSAEEGMQHLNSLQSGRATIACVNSPQSITISGDMCAIQELEEKLHDAVFSRRLLVEVAYHSHHMESVASEYLRLISHITPRDGLDFDNLRSYSPVSFFSSVTGTEVQPCYLGPPYWIRNLLSQVKFSDSVRALCFDTSIQRGLSGASSTERSRRAGSTRKVNIDALVEVGPHAALSGPIKQIIDDDQRLKAAELTYTSTLSRKSNAVNTALSVAATLACSGYPVNFRAINNPTPSQTTQALVDLPPYVWNHSRSYWAEPRLSKVFRNRKYPRSDILGVADTMACPSEPRWRNIVRLSEIPWLQDHKIQSNIVYPAAAYIVMAIEAVYQHIAESLVVDVAACTFRLQDISIKSALIIHEDSAVETMISLRHDDPGSKSPSSTYNFHIYSVTDENRWTEHCTGYVGIETKGFSIQGSSMEHSQQLDDVKSSVLNIRQFYAELSKAGLEYGSSFSNISKAQFADNICWANVTVPDTASVMPAGIESPHHIHPCTLDSIIHTIFTTMDIGSSAAVPVYLDEMLIAGDIGSTPGDELMVRTQTEHITKSHIMASIAVKGKDNTLAVSIQGLRCRKISSVSTDSEKHASRIAYKVEWRKDADMLGSISFSTVLNEDACQQVNGDDKVPMEVHALHYIRKAMAELSTGEEHGIPYDQKARLDFFQSVTEGTPAGSSSFSGRDANSIKPRGPRGKLLCSVGKILPKVLKDDADAIADMRSPTLWEDYWQEIHESPSYQCVCEYLRLICHKDPSISILELEAGHGGVYVKFLEQFRGEEDFLLLCTKYTVSDPALDFQDLDKRDSSFPDVLEFQKLDIEKDADVRAFNKHRYDVVVVPHGLYTVKSRQYSLKNIHRLLKTEGHLVLVDPAWTPTLTNSVIFAGHAAMWTNDTFGYSQDAWEKALIQSQFSMKHIANVGESFVIVATPSTTTTALSTDIRIIVDGDSTACGNHLQAQLVSASHTVKMAELQNASPAGKVCIVLTDLVKPVLASPDENTWLKIKAIFLEAKSLLWVTRGGSIAPINPEAGLATGFARTARSESGVDPIMTLDLDGRNPLREDEAATVIYNLVQTRMINKSGGLDTEYSERHGEILIPRVVEDRDINDRLVSLSRARANGYKTLHQRNPLLRAVSNGNGTLQISLSEDSPFMSNPDAFFRVTVQAINIERVGMTTTGCEDRSLRFEFSGIVQAAGNSACEFVPGDRVVSFTSSLGSTKASSIQKIPPEMSFDVASAIPKAYCTAMYVVRHLARVRSGDRVLVHSMATSVGQALIELCCRIGAETMAVVGDISERGLLQTTSMILRESILVNSDPDYPIQLRDLAAETLDVVINCGEYDKEVVEPLWSSLSPSGQFLQIQHQHSPRKRQWEIPPVGGDIRFATLDFHSLMSTKPDLIDMLWANVGQLLEHGALNGLTHIPSYPISKAEEAVERLEADPRVDSVVLTMTPHELKEIPLNPSAGLLRPEASYMLIGGLGGIGRASALWMADHGAKTLIFVSRSGLNKPSSQATVQDLEKRGVRVMVQACDVSDSQQMASLMSELTAKAPPIAGVMQAAMVLKDTHIENMTLADYLSVLRPKYAGTWNLHRTLPRTLDWFIMLSSISGLIGNPTQAAYAAGSTFMDAFAAYRHTLGLPAISLDLGVITDAGYLSENASLASKMSQQGFHGTDTKTLPALIEAAIVNSALPTPNNNNNPQIITGLGEWKEGHSLASFEAPLFAHFRRRFLDSSVWAQTGAASLVTLRAELQNAKTLEEASVVVYGALGARVAGHMAIPVESIDPGGPISEYGIDSHVAVELRNWIAKSMESMVPILEILASGSLMELAAKIAGKSALVDGNKGD
ncbi:hypothetical protein FE257_003186 [Aspergillus nanangensis]|uniref:Carrier domain-containing protein n=1 Tax=Aspergillus nanangensis TaxID=2582783 RepID=A0AAD4CD41_ASPNN|nr:hypothetical protein FE257_003186 [Aspergillus nanangensis]